MPQTETREFNDIDRDQPFSEDRGRGAAAADTTASEGADAPSGDGTQSETADQQGGEPDPSAEQPGEDSSAATTGEETETAEPAAEDGSEPDGDAESEAAEAGEGPEMDEAGEEAELEKPFQYIGPDEEELDDEVGDYVFVSEVDPSQRYETVDDLVAGYENLLEHRNRVSRERDQLQERTQNLQTDLEKQTKELEAEVSAFREAVGDEALKDVLKDQHMPDEFQGLSEEDITDHDRLREYIRAEQEAENQAEQEIERMNERVNQEVEQTEEFRERFRNRTEEADAFVDSIGHEDLGLQSQQEAETIVPEVVSEMEEEMGVNPVDLIFNVKAGVYEDFVPSVPSEDGEGEEPLVSADEADRAAELMVDGLRQRVQEKKQEKYESRTSRVQTSRKQKTAASTEVEPAEGSGEETRDVGNPHKAFRTA